MRAEKPKRVEVDPVQPGLAGLGAALEGLKLGPLPPGSVPSEAVVTPEKPRRRGRVILRKEKAHRGGKVVIVAHDFPPETTAAELEGLAKGLRQSIGTGGTVKEGTIEIQGDHAGKVRSYLQTAGYHVIGV